MIRKVIFLIAALISIVHCFEPRYETNLQQTNSKLTANTTNTSTSTNTTNTTPAANTKDTSNSSSTNQSSSSNSTTVTPTPSTNNNTTPNGNAKYNFNSTIDEYFGNFNAFLIGFSYQNIVPSALNCSKILESSIYVVNSTMNSWQNYTDATGEDVPF